MGSNWVVQTVTEPIYCNTTRAYLTREFSSQPSGTYRIEFYALTGTSQKRIHYYWGVYRSDTP